MRGALLASALALVACSAPEEPAPRIGAVEPRVTATSEAVHAPRANPTASEATHAPPANAPREATHAPSEPAAQIFGSAPDETRPLTRLSAIVDDPERYRDQVVRTEGEIAQVCQRMGCWMELREDASGPAVRVPMAGHRFFLPRDVAGRRAMLEGRVALSALSEGARAHLESEGATATASALAIHASGVVVR